MAEVFDFGLQQHKIKMDGKFFESNLFAVAGDTGRRLEVQLLDSNNMVQNTTGISLRLNANVAGQATYAEAALVDATKGLYELDLPNGMLIAPGNWQFQWQIIGTSGEKLHSFAFTGSVGINLSEGGSEATNFYLNVEDLKQMQEDLINGAIESAALETNIAEKLTDLEAQYAPKLTEVTEELNSNRNVLMFKGPFNLRSLPEIPNDFPHELPFRLWRDSFGSRVKHDVNFDSFENGAGKVYIDGYAGTDSNNGLSADSPVQSVNQALTIANGMSNQTVILNFLNETYDETRFLGVHNLTISKNIILKSASPLGRTLLHTGQRPNGVTWTQEGASYRTERSATTTVIDFKQLNADGIPLEYNLKDSIAQVQSTPGTYYTDGLRVWVHTYDDRIPDNNIILMLPKDYHLRFNLAAGKKLIMRNIHVYFETSTDDACEIRTPDTRNNGTEFWHEKCVFSRSKKSNGLGTIGVNYTYGFNSISHKNAADGFNYHCFAVYSDNNEFVFEYECKAYDNGVPGVGNANSTSAHDGMNVLRVGSVGYRSNGPVLADVNGCFSVNVDCTMYDSKSPARLTKAAFYFDSANAVKDGKAYLINCRGGGEDTYSVNSDDTIPIYIRDMIGTDIPEGNILLPY